MKKLTIGERIRFRRKELKLTQKSLAKALGLSDVSVSQWERDDSEPTGKNLFALGKALQCSATWILYGDKEQTPGVPVTQPLELDEQQREWLELFNSLPESEQLIQLEAMRVKVENYNRLFDELLKARKRNKTDS
ncbi:helix-turn-helix domain-containing protein [Escherichia albertii]|uniref:helix-turn-helix domain-containing protein n=1 Tax=Escherichia albertii TaxID=208962 RepID=UPI000743B0B0|nr:helix-turn-helix domain-containing protein [Escherichia albertii]MCZ8661476.1 helix-turn-helix domain-containing protein [Escherichia albertii]MCZ9009716.1 helix-turn-helix domain-containing protein [Escherichia albertii]